MSAELSAGMEAFVACKAAPARPSFNVRLRAPSSHKCCWKHWHPVLPNASLGLAALSSALLRHQKRQRHWRRSPRVACGLGLNLPWASPGKSSAVEDGAERWWREHPRSGDVLIGWVQHASLTGGKRVDLEAEFESSRGGVWRSRDLGFQGRFSVRMESPCRLTLKDDATLLQGTVRAAEAISGPVVHDGEGGGAFELHALPACYCEWWAKVNPQLKGDPNPTLVVVSEDGSVEDGDEPPDLSSPGAVHKFMMRKLSGEGGTDRSEKAARERATVRSRRVEILQKFRMRPDEVKAYLDRYVIRQSAAKEMLSVAICDHYNRAKEELLGSEWMRQEQSWGSDAGTAGEAKDGQQGIEEKHHPSIEKEAPKVGRLQEETGDKEETTKLATPGSHAAAQANGQEPDARRGSSNPSDSDTAYLQFEDTDNDVIVLKLEGDDVNEYVNGELEIEGVEVFEVDEEQRTYKDDTGHGSFSEKADLQDIATKVRKLFEAAQTRSVESKKHARNYTKPNILLLGPTGSGKTYLLRTLADLIGVPFVKADATKFTETGYVGRDAEDVMSDLLKAADGDAELAQAGIVYVDEIDKVCSEGEGKSAGFRRGTQSTFLKLMEDTEVTVGPTGLRELMISGMGGGSKLSTRHVLFVFSGAFSQLDEHLKEEHERKSKGFGFAGTADGKAADLESGSAAPKSLLQKASTDDLVKAGMEREFVGRIPVRVALDALSEDDLCAILMDAEEGATTQLVDDFRRYGIQLEFTDEALRAVARSAAKEGTGARSLVTILEGALRRFKFSLPALVPKGFSTLQVDEALINHPEERLQELLRRHSESVQA